MKIEMKQVDKMYNSWLKKVLLNLFRFRENFTLVPTNTYSVAAAPTIERLLLSLVIYPNRGGYYKREAPIRVRQLLQNLR